MLPMHFHYLGIIKFGWNLPTDSGVEDENMKSLHIYVTDRLTETDEPTYRQTTSGLNF